jgi:hypothetical protein
MKPLAKRIVGGFAIAALVAAIGFIIAGMMVLIDGK